MTDTTISQLTKENEALKRRVEILSMALHLLHGHSCQQSDFVYGVLHGAAMETIRQWESDRMAVFKASGRRFKARCRRSIAADKKARLA